MEISLLSFPFFLNFSRWIYQIMLNKHRTLVNIYNNFWTEVARVMDFIMSKFIDPMYLHMKCLKKKKCLLYRFFDGITYTQFPPIIFNHT